MDSETITSRSTKLNRLVLRKSTDVDVPNNYIASRDALFDALFALYDECNHDYMRKDCNIASFVDKFRSAVSSLKKMCVNKADFEVKKTIGRGHFGEVQVVREKATGAIYAMKILRKSSTLSQKNVAFYEEERDIMAKTSSPWLTHLQYAFQDNHNLYLVMEYHPGGNMLSLLANYDNVFPEQMARFYLAELVLAINSLHSMNYVHRDIKPDNILIDRTGHIKLADFGSAALLNPDKTVTTKMPVGTPDYVAPEVLMALEGNRSHKAKYGVESDWWSLGVVAYEMLFGELPFSEDTVVATYNNIMNFKNKLTFPDDQPDVSEEAVSLIKGLLQKADTRLNYEQLLQHPFFAEVDWYGLREVFPPYIPVTTGDDDTSHFDELEHEVARLRGDFTNIHEGFSGKNLPFIGFTYTANLTSHFDGNASQDLLHVSSPMHTSMNGLNTKEVEELKQKVTRLEETVISGQTRIANLQSRVKEKSDECSTLVEEKKNLEKNVARLKLEASNLKQQLSGDTMKFKTIEKDALQRVHDIKTKYKKKEEELRNELASKSNEVLELETKAKFLQEELCKSSRVVQRLSKEKEEIDRQILQCRESLQEEIEAINKKSQLQFSFIMQEKQKLQEKINEKEAINEALKEENTKLKKELENSANLKNNEEMISLQNSVEEKEALLNELNEKLNNERAEFENIVQIQETEIGQLKNEIEKFQNILSSTKDEHSKSVEQMKKELVDAKNAQEKLKTDLWNLSEREVELNQCIKEMELQINNKEKEIESLKVANENLKMSFIVDEPDNHVGMGDSAAVATTVRPETEMNEQIMELKDKLSRAKDMLTEEKNVRHNLEALLKQKEKELSESQLDLRLATRKVLRAEKTNAAITQSNAELQQKLADSEKSISEAKEMENSLKETIEKLRDQNLVQKNELEDKARILEVEKAKLQQEITGLLMSYNELKDAKEAGVRLEGQYQEAKLQNDALKKDLISLNNMLNTRKQQNIELEQRLQENEEQRNAQEVNLKMLQTASAEMDAQLERYSALYESRSEALKEAEKKSESLKREIRRLEEEAKDLSAKLIQEKKRVADVTQQLEDAQEEADTQITMLQNQISSLEDQLEEYRKSTEQLTTENGHLENALSGKEAAMTRQQALISDLRDEIFMLKEESAKHLTQLLSTKSSNKKLCEALEQEMDENKILQKQIEKLQNISESESESHELERLKLQQTINQQRKLIDFLQMKIEGLEKKKTPMRLFRQKSKDSGIPLQFKELEDLLEKERAKNRKLQAKLEKIKAENMAYHTELRRISSKASDSSVGSGKYTVTKLVTSGHTEEHEPPGQNDGFSLPRKDSGSMQQRMQHNIPHRFNETLCMRATKCAACLDSIHFGRHMSKCQECSVSCHTKCSHSLGNTCGIPSGYMLHLAEAMRNRDECDGIAPASHGVVPSEDIEVKLEGWLKVPRTGNNVWDRRFARLQGTVLAIFKKECPKDALLSSACTYINLQSSEKEVIINSAVPPTELPGTAKTDLPYILKVECCLRSSAQVEQKLYLMASTFEEKKMWVTAIEEVVNECSGNQDLLDERLSQCRFLNLESKLDVNCAYFLSENALLLGAKEGLFLVIDPLKNATQRIKPQKIEGVSSVYQMGVAQSVDLVVLIEDRKLRTAKLSSLYQWTSSSRSIPPDAMLQLRPVGNVRECHLFSLSENQNHKNIFLFTAGEKEVCLLAWSTKEDMFLLNKRYQTVQPCSCVHFTQEIAIFGADKFYELDLKYFTVEEFLEPTDTNLSFFIYAAESNQVLPIAVFPVFQPGEEEEYLLCFSTTGVFVDGQGRYTRGHIKWTRLPLSFAYCSPNLLVVHVDSLEVIHTDLQENFEGEPARQVLKIAGPRYLGPSNTAQGVLLASMQEDLVSLFWIDGSLTADGSATPCSLREDSGSEESAFSFSSSLVKVLESSP